MLVFRVQLCTCTTALVQGLLWEVGHDFVFSQEADLDISVHRTNEDVLESTKMHDIFLLSPLCM